ncbi:hypothetical protein ACQR16_21410 [Bradyrhizobium oligotrophicum]|uniref:hypothetical protein n=1 Tax=Bradyrhizobium oligotrophicum TaxID=44255 RepID=UPI003EB6CE36
MISDKKKLEYFRGEIWTGVIMLRAQRNFLFWRIRSGALARGCDGGSAMHLVMALNRVARRVPSPWYLPEEARDG